MSKASREDEEAATGGAYDWRAVRRLAAYHKPYARPLAAAAGLTLVLTALRIAQPKFTQYAVDWYILPRDASGLRWLALAYAGVLLLTFAFTYLQTRLLEATALRVTCDLRVRLFEKFQRQELAYYDRTPLGRMLTRLTADTASVRQLCTSVVTGALSDILLLVAIIALMLSLDWRLTLLTLITVPPLFAVAGWFRRHVRRSYDEARVRFTRLYSFLHECVAGAPTVQLFGREAESLEKLDGLNRDLMRTNARISIYQAVFTPVTDLIGALGVAFVVWYGGLRLGHGAPVRDVLSLGALIAFVQYAQQLFYPVRDVLYRFNSLQSALVASHRIFSTLDLPVALAPPARRRAGRAAGRVEFRDVWFAYRGEEWVIKGISFVVEPGETVALVGHTGSGKTTIANLLMRFHDAQRGHVLFDGTDVRDWDARELRRNTALVLQDPVLFSGTLGGNINLGRDDVTPERVEWVKRELRLDDFFGRLPAGYETEVRGRAADFSPGQKQLIAIARAIALDPPLPILDEATSVIDAETERVIQRALGRLMHGRASLVIAHRLSTVRRADRIIVLDHGEIREQGTHRALLDAKGFYWQLYRLTLPSEPRPRSAADSGG
ncbi:MAG: ABC transporter ATP-binding protein/permease [Acidobacteria bacterium]|nr:ABC transporter ATP-binding protein/permease [Acidobacteriota bacterium]MCA1618600.1 ABC transporter ATP-binding protein/permease [Acidobacteriota bacterium]